MDTVVRKENRDLIIKILELKEKLKAVILLTIIKFLRFRRLLIIWVTLWS